MEYEVEYRVKNLYDQKPTEEECIQCAIDMAKAQLDLGISPDESMKILEKLEPQYLRPNPMPFIQTINILPEMLMDNVIPSVMQAINQFEPSRTQTIVKSSLRKVRDMLLGTLRVLYDDGE